MASGTIKKTQELKAINFTDRSIDSNGNVAIPTITWANAIPVCFKPTGIPQGTLRSWKWARYNNAIYLVWSVPADSTLSGTVYYYEI